MEKNTVWAIVLSTIVLVAFMFFQTIFFPSSNKESSTVETVTESTVVPENEIVQNDSIVPEISSDIQQAETQQEEVAIPEQTYTISTEKVKVVFSNKGGDIISYQLLEHATGTEFIEMADNISNTNRAFALSFGGTNNAIINETFNTKLINDTSIGFYKNFSVKNNDGTVGTFTLVKQYTFEPEDYMFRLDIQILGEDNMSSLNVDGIAYTLRTSPQIGPHYDSKNRYENRTFMSYTNDKKKKQILSSGQTKVYDKTYTWTGIAGKYFSTLVVPVTPTSMTGAFYSSLVEVDDYQNSQVMLTRTAISEKDTKDTYYVYIGPRTEKELAIYNKAVENPWGLADLRLNDSLDSTGILSWLEIFLKWCMELIYKLIPNWGVAIIIMTVLLKAVLFPLTKKSSVSSLKMQEIQPRMTELQTKYKEQPDKLNAEMAKLYKETGYNPMSGCLPLLIQFPLIFAMYNLFNNYFEFRGAMFIPGWIPDLSVGDSVLTFGFNIPILGNELRILPIIYVFSQLLYGKLTQNATAGQNATSMKLMMYGMPLFFFFIFYNAPSGLLLYWTVSNVLQLFQQMIINKIMKAKKEEMALSKGSETPVFVPKKKKK